MLSDFEELFSVFASEESKELEKIKSELKKIKTKYGYACGEKKELKNRVHDLEQLKPFHEYSTNELMTEVLSRGHLAFKLGSNSKISAEFDSVPKYSPIWSFGNLFRI